MIGFDAYLPLKWLEERALVVRLRVVKPVAREVFRHGKWALQGAVSLALVVATATASATFNLPSGSTVELSRKSAQMLLDLQPADLPAEAALSEAPLAPAGYHERVLTVVRNAPRLSAQSLEFDPPFIF